MNTKCTYITITNRQCNREVNEEILGKGISFCTYHLKTKKVKDVLLSQGHDPSLIEDLSSGKFFSYIKVFSRANEQFTKKEANSINFCKNEDQSSSNEINQEEQISPIDVQISPVDVQIEDIPVEEEYENNIKFYSDEDEENEEEVEKVCKEDLQTIKRVISSISSLVFLDIVINLEDSDNEIIRDKLIQVRHALFHKLLRNLLAFDDLNFELSSGIRNTFIKQFEFNPNGYFTDSLYSEQVLITLNKELEDIISEYK